MLGHGSAFLRIWMGCSGLHIDQVNRFSQPISPRNGSKFQTVIWVIWKELNHQEWLYCIIFNMHHILIIYSLYIHQYSICINPLPVEKKQRIAKKKSGGFFHLCSTTNIVQSFEPQGCRSHGSSFQWSSKFCWMLKGMACYSKTLGSLASSIYLTVKQVVVLIFFVDSHFLIPSISIQKNKARCSCRFIP